MEIVSDIVIVGAGISGLATALALHRLGIKCLVLESADILRAAGITITVWTNAWRALDALGLGDSLRKQHDQLVGICCSSLVTGDLTSNVSLTSKGKYGDHEVRCVKRKVLLEALAKELPSEKAMAVAVEPSMEVTTNKKPVTKQRRVVVTGMGVVSPLGHEIGVFYNNLLEGVSGISEIETFDCASFPTRIAGEIKSFSTEGWVAPKLSKRMDKFMLYMLTAGKKALVDAGLTEEIMNDINKTKCGVLIGSAMGGMKVFNDAIECQFNFWTSKEATVRQSPIQNLLETSIST